MVLLHDGHVDSQCRVRGVDPCLSYHLCCGNSVIPTIRPAWCQRLVACCKKLRYDCCSAKVLGRKKSRSTPLIPSLAQSFITESIKRDDRFSTEHISANDSVRPAPPSVTQIFNVDSLLLLLLLSLLAAAAVCVTVFSSAMMFLLLLLLCVALLTGIIAAACCCYSAVANVAAAEL